MRRDAIGPYEKDATTLRSPWPFTGREDELDLVGRSLTGARRGLVVTGAAGRGKTRLVTEAVRGTDCARVTATPQTRHLPFAAFAPLLPEPVTPHRALRHLSGMRTLLVDDAHLLDDASAALVHQLAVCGGIRLLVVVTDGEPVPAAVSRLWTGELLPRLALRPLPREDTARLLAADADHTPEPLTAHRLHRLCDGDLRLLRELTDAVREHGRDIRVPGTDTWAWRGPLPLTPAVRERTGRLLDRARPEERETLDRLAFAEPLPLDADDLDLTVLERLETDGLIHVDDLGGISLAHPVHGQVLRAAAGRLRARRLAHAPEDCAPALDAEAAELTRRIAQADVAAVPAPVGDWLAGEGEPVTAGYAALRARYARLRGELRDSAAWAREGLRTAPADAACRAALTLAEGIPEADGDPYDAVRLGSPERAAGRLNGVFADHADALARADGPALDRVAEELQRRGFLLFAAEAYAQAVPAHREPHAARTARTRAAALARRCQGARTPALAGLVLGELTARQRQIVTLAAEGLSNRQIAERLTLSVRTVGNHLYGAYTRLGTPSRATLGRFTDPLRTQPA
ncbi:LuxR family transcriptional regulator AbsR2 [Streptomyces griseoloalbus]|uniref:DNA-binding CsgD family transcriptional regulator n=1 Tax=Streptomyces griseoloalbus TaxID=67303 RepID=A0A7W8F8X1_9ACTN|nr:LuxR C-terminal-related transcriptional regulator [Streptomyces albaduncus]MBB5125659.1 DNA-binding CsgD family transcriptional regulator [Streptomyces albaduncus]GGW56183.1 helix-turn-helix transcriptional regulator [Streptomyces albaduncus]